MHLWVEEKTTTMCVHNHSPHRVLENKNSDEDFSRENPNAMHLRIFGFQGNIHVAKEKQTKIDPSGRNCIFIGYIDT